MSTIGVFHKHDSVSVLIFMALPRKERMRLLYEYSELGEVPLSALAKAERQKEEHVS